MNSTTNHPERDPQFCAARELLIAIWIYHPDAVRDTIDWVQRSSYLWPSWQLEAMLAEYQKLPGNNP